MLWATLFELVADAGKLRGVDVLENDGVEAKEDEVEVEDVGELDLELEGRNRLGSMVRLSGAGAWKVSSVGSVQPDEPQHAQRLVLGL